METARDPEQALNMWNCPLIHMTMKPLVVRTAKIESYT